MRPRLVINRGIQKVITAVSSYFVEGNSYTAVIYNPKYKDTKILANYDCSVVDGNNTCVFTYDGNMTEKLKDGYATIEIYDSEHTLMVYRENFAIIRSNSLQMGN